jgi:isocitrate dehydrogenase
VPAKTPITVAHGDGIGPEIMAASLHVMQEAGAQIELETIEIGEKVYLRGNSAGIEPSAWDSLSRTRVLYKAPITTVRGGGCKSANITLRKRLGLYANVRPCRAYAPCVTTRHAGLDVVIVRENEEDLYVGIEYQLSPDVMQSIKLISRPGTEKVVRFAFEYARQNGRTKVTCFTKDNVMKMSDGLFHRIFDEIAAEYTEIENEHWSFDLGAARLADKPEAFDVLVMPNLYGDVVSDIAAQISGSVGLAGSANVGATASMFEAIHGSARRRAGQNLANPSGLLLGGVMLLVHIGQWEIAERIHNAWLRTLEDGIHTYDIYTEGISKEKVGTKEFANAVVSRLGQVPEKLKAVSYAGAQSPRREWTPDPNRMAPAVEQVGVDLYLGSRGQAPEEFGNALGSIAHEGLKLKMIDSLGTIVWPGGMKETFVIDSYRCRFEADGRPVSHAQIAGLYSKVANAGYDIVKTESLRNFDGKQGFTLAQGQ